MKEIKLFIHDLLVRVMDQRTRESSSQSHAFNNGAIKALEKVYKFIDEEYPEGGTTMQAQQVLVTTIKRQLNSLKKIVSEGNFDDSELSYINPWIDEIMASVKLLEDVVSVAATESSGAKKKVTRKLNLSEEDDA